jgi:hypothetical protein
MSSKKKRVVMFSGGIGSWACAKRVAETHGTEDLYLVFSDVKGDATSPHIGEDEDTYRFIEEAAANVGGRLVWLRDGRDIWQVFKDERWLGNSRLAHCSHRLKQKPAREWLEANCHPEETVVYVGIDWTEVHRVAAIEKAYKPYEAVAPLTEPPLMSKAEMIEWARTEGLRTPRLYDLGFAHNNCGGGCVKAGKAQWRHLLRVMPDRFAVWEEHELDLRDYLDKPVSILTETINGEKRSLTLRDLRIRSESQGELFDDLDFGGCGCFVDYEDTASDETRNAPEREGSRFLGRTKESDTS